MRSRTPLTLVVGALTTLLPGGPAAAGEARCLWDALAPASQDRLLAAWTRSGAVGLADVKLEPAETRRHLTRCAQLGGVVDPRRATRAVELALRGYVARSGASAALAASMGYDDGQLDLAWRELGAEKRAVLRADAERTGDSSGRLPIWSAVAQPVLGEFFLNMDRISTLIRPDPAVDRQLEAYVAGRSLQEAFEPRF